MASNDITIGDPFSLQVLQKQNTMASSKAVKSKKSFPLKMEVGIGDHLYIKRDGKVNSEMFVVTSFFGNRNGKCEIILTSAKVASTKKAYITIKNAIVF